MRSVRTNRVLESVLNSGFIGLGLLVLSAPVFADISGTVTTQAGKPVAGAIIRFIDASDSSSETRAVTNAQGAYTLKLPASTTAIATRPSRPFLRGALRHAFLPSEAPAYDLRGRTAQVRNHRREPGFFFMKPDAQGAEAEPERVDGAGDGTSGTEAPKSVSKSGAAAAGNFHVAVYGKGVFPYQVRGLAVGDGETKDFKLAAVDAWDSARSILRDNLGNCGYRFGTQKQGRVAFLGGSITFNSGWRDSVQNYLKQKFPGTAFEFINAGIPSVGSDMHGFRFRRDVLQKGKVDLLFFESAVNDTTNGVPSTVRTRAYEGILRQAWKDNPLMDIVFLYFADPSFYPNVKAGKPNALITDYEKSAAAYGVSSINLAQYVAERYTWEQFGGDVHPGPLGQGIYFRSIRRLFETAWGGPAGAAPGGEAPGGAAPSVEASPIAHTPPGRMLDSLCFHQGHTDTISKAVLANGWRKVASWVPTQGGTRDGFFKVPVLESTTPGDTLKIAFTGTAVGMVIPAGPDVGMIEFAIDGKILGTRDQFTPWSSGLNIPWTHIFASDLAMKAHELRLVVSPGKNAASTGHACRIIRFVVNGP